MVFNSLEFIVFALLFFLIWPFAKKKNQTKWSFIVLMSFIFYGWWDWRFLFLIVGSGLIDYYAGLLIYRIPKQKALWLALSLIGNIGSLSVFKYSLFIAKVLEDGASLIGWPLSLQDSIPAFALILPVGISFFTFQSMSYTIDIYRGRLLPTTNLLHFFSYLAMFPQLVAGPIVRAKDLLQQLAQHRNVNALQRWNATKLIAFGLFQKTVIADNLSLLIDSAFEGKIAYSDSPFWWFVMLAFSFQIYCDFSGYSLMARGLAKYMGYHFKMNFNHPYLSHSLRMFWSRWHISLSTWFRDYVYIPLGGSKQGLWKGIFLLWITMLVSGLWHGANYTFLAWAAIHSAFLSIERLTRWNAFIAKSNFQFMLIPIVFVQCLIAWVYFRAETIEQGHQITNNLFAFEFNSFEFIMTYFDATIALSIAVLIEISIGLKRYFTKLNTLSKSSNLDVALVALSLLAALFFRGQGQQFIYFQF